MNKASRSDVEDKNTRTQSDSRNRFCSRKDHRDRVERHPLGYRTGWCSDSQRRVYIHAISYFLQRRIQAPNVHISEWRNVVL